MDISLVGKNAFVGGSSKGIGRAIATELALLGANVTLVARSADLLEDVKSELSTDADQEHTIAQIDYDEPQALGDRIEQLTQDRTYHIVINNSGGPAAGSLIDAETTEFAEAFQRHIIASHIIMKAVLPGMKTAGYGRFINVISTSVKEPIAGLGVSNTIRGAMANWAKTLAAEVGENEITVNNILPGYTATGRLENIIVNKAQKKKSTQKSVKESMQSNVPFGRFADPSEIASVAAFLATPAAGYINGTNVPVDGGRTRSL